LQQNIKEIYDNTGRNIWWNFHMLWPHLKLFVIYHNHHPHLILYNQTLAPSVSTPFLWHASCLVITEAFLRLTTVTGD